MSGSGTTTVEGPLVMGAADGSDHAETLDQRTLTIAGPASYNGAGAFHTQNDALVLKNPADYYFNFWAVHQMLPRAKFIFIHRHPLSMFNSYLHGFPAILTQRSNYASLLDKRYDALFGRSSLRRRLFLAVFRSNMMSRLLLTRLIESFQYYLAHVSQLPPEQYVSVRYEDLCADPVGCLSRIGTQLRLNLVPRVPAGFVAPRHLPVPERVKRHYAERVADMAPYLQHCQYTAWQE